jgi:hypothetical protein
MHAARVIVPLVRSVLLIALIVAGCASVMWIAGRQAGDFVTGASAATAGHAQIATVGAPADWSTSVSDVWVTDNMRPGDAVVGAVRLKTVGTLAPGASLRLTTTFPGGLDPSLAAVLRISEMHLGPTDLLARWPDACRAALTLATLGTSCPSPELPPPGADPGDEFHMTLQLDIRTGNAYQGSTTGPVTFLFTLTDGAPPAATPADAASPSSTPASSAPVLGAAPVPTAPSAVVSTPASGTITPRPPRTGNAGLTASNSASRETRLCGIGCAVVLVLASRFLVSPKRVRDARRSVR